MRLFFYRWFFPKDVTVPITEVSMAISAIDAGTLPAAAGRTRAWILTLNNDALRRL
jgi:hypothetical protein